jgi:hypothetical protein
MPVQTNRTDDRQFTAAGTGPPYNPATTRSLSPVVAVLGDPGRVAGLGSHLPAGWSARAVRDLDDVRADEIVLFTSAREQDIRHARTVLPRRAPIVALVDSHAPAELVAAVLTAGADVCVRGGRPAILAGHLVACRRRQLADRWAGLAASAQV